jgi:hypothetical protein
VSADHTPGPWNTAGLNIRNQDGGLICTVTNLWADKATPQNVKEANARLISYAPLMLESVVMALQFLEIVQDSAKDKDPDLSRAAGLLAIGFECVISSATETNENRTNN